MGSLRGEQSRGFKQSDVRNSGAEVEVSLMSPAISLGSTIPRSRVRVHLAAWLLASAALLLLGIGDELHRVPVAWASLGVVGGGLFSLSRCAEKGFWSPACLYLLVFGIFHLGLALHVVTGVDPLLPRDADYVWFEGEVGTKALYVSSLGAIAFIVAALIVLAVQRDLKEGARVPDRALASRYSTTGSAILLLATAAWFVTSVISVGFGGLFGAYQDFLSETEGTSVNLTYPLIGVGLGLTVLAKPGLLGKIALSLFFLFAIIGFFIGLRGEVLFPVAVAASVMASRRKMPSVPFVLVGLLVLLTLVNAAKQIRQDGIADSSFSLSDATPMAALSELGSTLRVVATVFGWHDAGGEAFRHGDTYTAWLIRMAERMGVGGLGPRPPSEADFRLFNVEIASRAGNIGGSVIGEAYHNFAAIGVIAIMAAIGAVFAYYSRRHLTVLEIATFVVVALPLHNHIRNSFVPVVPMLIFGLLLVAAVWLISRRAESEGP